MQSDTSGDRPGHTDRFNEEAYENDLRSAMLAAFWTRYSDVAAILAALGFAIGWVQLVIVARQLGVGLSALGISTQDLILLGVVNVLCLLAGVLVPIVLPWKWALVALPFALASFSLMLGVFYGILMFGCFLLAKVAATVANTRSTAQFFGHDHAQGRPEVSWSRLPRLRPDISGGFRLPYGAIAINATAVLSLTLLLTSSWIQDVRESGRVPITRGPVVLAVLLNPHTAVVATPGGEVMCTGRVGSNVVFTSMWIAVLNDVSEELVDCIPGHQAHGDSLFGSDPTTTTNP